MRSTFWEKNSIDIVLPEPWVCQNTPSLPALLRRSIPQLLQSCEGVVDTEVLVIAGKQLDEAPGQVLEGHEVLDQVEEAFLGAHAPDDGLQGDLSLPRPQS